MVCLMPRGARRSWAVVFVMVSLVIPHTAAAQEPPTFELPAVVVPGRRPQPWGMTPASVTVITREEIARSGARTIAGLLQRVPEISVRGYSALGGLAEASVRGSTPAQVLVLLDGVPLNSVALGQADLSTISVDAVERIEVLRGPFAAAYGSGALGGVINVVTSRTGRGRILVRAGGFDDRSVTASAGGTTPLPGQLTITSDATAGHRNNSDYEGTTVAARFGLSTGTAMLVHYYSADLGTPGSLTFLTPADRQSQRRVLVQIDGDRALGVPQWGRLYYVSDTLTFESSSGNSTYYAATAGGEFQRAWEFGPGRSLVGGVEAQAQTLDAVVFGSPIVQAAVVGAGYLQYDAVVSDRMVVSVGARIDWHSVYGATANPRAGFVYRVNDTTRLRAAVGRTFRGPTFLELFYPAPFGNPALAPERAWAAELGVERRAGDIMFGATLFGTEATDLIVGGAPSQNVGAASVRGLSGEIRGMVGPHLMVLASVTLMQASDRATGNPLPRVPGVGASVVLSHRTTESAILSLTAAYVGPRSDLDFSSVPAATVQLPGYVDLRIRYELAAAGGWAIILGVDNALDYLYEPVKGYPAPGRSVYVTARLEF